MRNRFARNLLRNWRYFDDNFQTLVEGQISNMKLLYKGLKQLSDQDLHYLTIKYYIPRENITNGIYFLRDDVVAKKLGMTHEQYRKCRIQAEMELQKHVEDVKYTNKYL